MTRIVSLEVNEQEIRALYDALYDAFMVSDLGRNELDINEKLIKKLQKALKDVDWANKYPNSHVIRISPGKISC